MYLKCSSQEVVSRETNRYWGKRSCSHEFGAVNWFRYIVSGRFNGRCPLSLIIKSWRLTKWLWIWWRQTVGLKINSEKKSRFSMGWVITLFPFALMGITSKMPGNLYKIFQNYRTIYQAISHTILNRKYWVHFFSISPPQAF